MLSSFKGLVVFNNDICTFDKQSTEVRHLGANNVGSLYIKYYPFFSSTNTETFNLISYADGPLLVFDGSNNQIRFYPDQDDTTNYCSLADTVIDTYSNIKYADIFCSWDYENGNATLRIGSNTDTLSSISGWSGEISTLTLGGSGIFAEFYRDSIFRYDVDGSGIPSFDRWDAASMYIFDDFEDGDDSTYTAGQSTSGRNSEYPTWTVNTGTWRLNSGGYLDKTATDNIYEYIYTLNTNFDDVVWEFDFEMADSTQDNLRIYLVNESNPISATVDGYLFAIFDSPGNQFYLYRIDNSAVSIIISGAWTPDNNKHNVKIVRRSGGLWELILDGVNNGVVYDNTHTSITHNVLSLYRTGITIDNYHVRHLHSKEFNSLETLNYDTNVLTTPSTMNSKSCDVIRFRYKDNSNTEKSINVGRIVAGAYSTPTKNYNIEYEDVIEDSSTTIITESGSEYFISKPKKRRFTLTFTNVGDSQDDEMETLFESIGTTKPILISIDPDNHPEEAVLCRLTRPFVRTRTVNKRSSFTIEFLEII